MVWWMTISWLITDLWKLDYIASQCHTISCYNHTHWFWLVWCPHCALLVLPKRAQRLCTLFGTMDDLLWTAKLLDVSILPTFIDKLNNNLHHQYMYYETYQHSVQRQHHTNIKIMFTFFERWQFIYWYFHHIYLLVHIRSCFESRTTIQHTTSVYHYMSESFWPATHHNRYKNIDTPETDGLKCLWL